MIRQFELVDLVRAYDKNVDEALLNRAYVFAMKAHGTQKRASGDPYFSHPLEVAGILTSMKLDSDTIATALLHDVVEDTVATIPEIDEAFGPKIAELVDGVTKLSKIELQTESVRQAENFRKFLLAMSNDIRVLLVKLADRLHNMRTLFHIKKREKRRRISLETLEIYAPLAERLGMNELKDELQHLALEHFDPEAMEAITTRLNYLIEQDPYLEKETIETLRNLLRENGVDAEVYGRIKKPYSIWRKMENRKIEFEQLSDVLAFRIVVPEAADCYKALGIVHQTYSVIPGRFKDYISIPKPNFYRSIHTTVIGPNKRPLEVQIRTFEMHDEADYGVAAHWQYKQGTGVENGSQYRWMQELLDINAQSDDAEDFMEHSKLAMFKDQVFCYTPKGEIVPLPKGATCVDFAYAVHTEVGNRCVGAKVNSRMVPLRNKLQNGDQVEILTSKDQTPSQRWQSFVVTGRARSAIKRYIKNKEYAEYSQLGRNLIERACRRNGYEFSETVIDDAAKVMKLDDAEMLYTYLGQGALSEDAVLRSAFPGFQEDKRSDALPLVHQDDEAISGDVISVSGIKEGTAFHLSSCCSPIKGDRIIGIKRPGQGVQIHRTECPELAAFDEMPELWVDIGWKTNEDDDFYVALLSLDVVNQRGVLAEIASIVAKNGGNVSNLIIPERDPEFYVMHIDVEVRDDEHLKTIMRTMRISKLVSRVDRINRLGDKETA
ncbi:bifunctional (p)ppGpp synthetase/guanosine-3',5'-bis(diphosphate) 3'-pyrophosphohydrolase [Kordiimonas sp. SCSIO 12610]|uniref:RelA/SpoT family protein n=1 Tax=Kordiimonas sp. SCSIO 12610 TaxID=2829597 RepID=UPI00210D5A52|nr:bifunctional (p)ppGpp synthetase/guanosine-3',5'-bis(diphosphate) 3'-pyrophosphohydrolase [Kordiimonas sp. SCSIO 12610]UTW56666.1 bifunctional (p)ppGpp synthetase/guanosine-3',5'-bis(diphosphate) 3'-pyrophosphohydrolase [Kordiimonas sp. SCSIO 12610]